MLGSYQITKKTFFKKMNMLKIKERNSSYYKIVNTYCDNPKKALSDKVLAKYSESQQYETNLFISFFSIFPVMLPLHPISSLLFFYFSLIHFFIYKFIYIKWQAEFSQLTKTTLDISIREVFNIDPQTGNLLEILEEQMEQY